MKISDIGKHIVLIQPQCSFELEGEPALNTQFDSIGLLSLASYLRSLGRPVKIFHFPRALELGYKADALFDQIADLSPLVCGISINWLHLSRGAIEVANILKQRFPNVPVVVGGQHASFFAEEIVRGYHSVIDGVVVGEGEETLAEIVEHAELGQPLDGISGLMTHRDGEVVYSPRQVSLDVDGLPLISYDSVFPVVGSGDPAGRVAALDTCRGGCRKNCSYCLESSTLGAFGRAGPVRYSIERLVDQVEAFVREGRDWITIQDQFFTHGDEPMLRFIDEILRRGVRLQHLSLFLEPGSYSRDVYDHLAELPADEIVLSFGVETGSPKVARNVNRFHHYDAIYREFEYLSAKPFLSSSWWMLGLPEEGPEEVAMTRDMIVETMKLGIHPKWVTPLILFPQTDLARERERFEIRQLLVTFDDFTRFSVTPRNEYGEYPELITHESTHQSAEDTLRYLVEIKRLSRRITRRSNEFPRTRSTSRSSRGFVSRRSSEPSVRRKSLPSRRNPPYSPIFIRRCCAASFQR